MMGYPGIKSSGSLQKSNDNIFRKEGEKNKNFSNE
jgi:hypothetical protein